LDKNIIEQYISNSRLASYQNIEEYKQNILYSQEYYTILCILEISLRNSINKHFNFKFGNNWHNHQFLHQDSLLKIKEVKKRIISSKKDKT